MTLKVGDKVLHFASKRTGVIAAHPDPELLIACYSDNSGQWCIVVRKDGTLVNGATHQVVVTLVDEVMERFNNEPVSVRDLIRKLVKTGYTANSATVLYRGLGYTADEAGHVVRCIEDMRP